MSGPPDPADPTEDAGDTSDQSTNTDQARTCRDAANDLEERLAHDRYLRQKAQGTLAPGVPQGEARRLLLERINQHDPTGV